MSILIQNLTHVYMDEPLDGHFKQINKILIVDIQLFQTRLFEMFEFSERKCKLTILSISSLFFFISDPEGKVDF